MEASAETQSAELGDAEQLEELLGHRFGRRELLRQALTHSSQRHESGGAASDNERLEFFGDAILQMLVTEQLFERYTQRSEGELSKLRARVVRTTTLARRARGLRLGDFLLLGRGEERGGGRTKSSILADAFEALVAAVYLDGGLEAARAFVERHLLETIGQAADQHEPTDFKSSLQVLSQKRLGCTPSYRLLSQEGPEHDKTFRVEVQLDGRFRKEGWGKSKKLAEQEAARLCWLDLQEQEDSVPT